MRFLLFIILSFFSAYFIQAQTCPLPQLSGGARVCLDNNQTQLKLTGTSGVIQWESSTDNITYSLIPDSVAVVLTIDNLKVKTYYRAVVTEATCGALVSNVDSIVVDALSVVGAVSGGQSVCVDGNSTVLQLSDHLGAIQWQSSVDGINFTAITDSVSATLTIGDLTNTTYYQAVVTNGACSSVTSNMDSIVVDALSVVGAVSGGQSVCVDGNSTVLQLSDHLGAIQWQSSADGINFTAITDSVSATLTIGNLTNTTYYQAVVTNGACSSVTSNMDSIVVDALSVVGAVSGGQSVCVDGNSTVLQLSDHLGAIQWQSSADGINFTAITDSVSATLTIGNLTNTTYYQAVVTNGACSSVTSNMDSIVVDALSVVGAVSGGQSVCVDGNSTVLQLSDHLGAIQWQSSADGVNFTAITDSVSATLTIGNLTNTTYYQAVVTNGSCSSVTSNMDSIVVDALSVVGAVSGGQSVCVDGNSTVLQLSDHLGAIQWQSSADGINFTAITDSVSATLTIGNLTNTTYYQAVVTNGSCSSVTSNMDSIVVDALSVVGAVSGGQSVCVDGNSTVLQLSNHLGAIQWQSSEDGINFTAITDSVSATLTIGNLTNTTYYQAVVTNGSCSSVTSNMDSIVVDALSVVGAVSGGQSVCVDGNSTVLQLSDHLGAIQWQSSADGINFTAITDSVSATLTIGNLTNTTYYQAVVTNGACSSVTSNMDSILVDPLSFADSVKGGSRVCVDGNSTELRLTGYIGSIQWQSSLDGLTFVDTVGSVNPTLLVNSLLDTMYYRAVVTSGVCAPMISSVDSIMVDPLSVEGKLTSAADTVCALVNTTLLKLTGSLGKIQWFSSIDGNNFNIINGVTDSLYLSTNLTETMYYKAIVKNGVCASAETSPILINVTPTSLAGNISGAGEVCNGRNSSNLVLKGSRGDIQWQSSSNGVDFTDILNQRTVDFSISNLNADVFYRVLVKNGICPESTSPIVKIKVNPLPDAPFASDTARCQPGILQLTAVPSVGSTVDWFSTSSGGNVLTGGLGTNLFYTPGLSINTSFYAQARNLTTGCVSATRTPVLARIDALSVSGTITGEREVCTGVNNTALLINGQRGVIQWQKSLDNLIFTDIQGANQSVFNAVDLTTSTYYRVSIKNGVCDALSSASVKMIVSQPSASGIITGMKAVCAENNSTILKASGTNGVIQWQSSTNRTLFSDIPGANADSLLTLNLIKTTYYRVVVKNGSCVSSASPEVTMTVNALPQAPVTQDGSRCGIGQIILRAFPPTGISNVVDWYLDSIPQNDLPIKVASNIFVTPDVVGDIFYYAQTRNRVTGCISKTRVAALAEIIPYAKTGTVSGDTIVCAGINQVGLKITGQEGRIQWQMSTDNINFIDIINAKTDTLTVSNLDSTHYYRVLLNADNGCNPSITDTFRILAPQPSFAGSIHGVREVCYGADSIQLNLKGYIGEIQWQSSLDSLSFNDINQARDSILTLNRITQSTFYRVKLQSGVCAPDTGNIVKINVNELPLAPVSKDVVNCKIGPVELNASVPIGITTDWYAVSTGGNILNKGQSTGTYFSDTLSSTVDFFVESRNLTTGCLSSTRTKTTALFDPANIPLISGDPGLCNGDSLLLKADQTYGLQWFFNGDTLQGIQTPSIIVRKFGEYKVLFTNKSGCSNESPVKTVLGYPDILGTLVKPENTDICDGYPFLLSASGSFAYQWYKNGAKVQDSVSSSFFTNSSGVYSVQYISDKGCKIMDPDSIKLRLIKSPDAKYAIGSTTCINIPVEFINKSVVSESGNVIYKWEFGNGKTDTGFVMNHVYGKPGLYMTRLVVTPTSCVMLADTALMYVKVESPLPAIRYPAVNAVLNRSIGLEARDFGAKYLWTPSTGLSAATVRNPETKLTQQQDYRIAITTAAGCTTTDSLLVRVFRENDIMVPEGFSPNADGQNDRLYPFLIGIRQMNMFKVYDRWGNLIFDNKMANASTGWEGYFKGNPLPAGPYVWMAEGIDVDDKVIRRSGTTILIR